MTFVRFGEFWFDEPHPSFDVMLTSLGLRVGIERWAPPRAERHEDRVWGCSPVLDGEDFARYLRKQLGSVIELLDEFGRVQILRWYDEERLDRSIDYAPFEDDVFKLRVTRTMSAGIRIDMHANSLLTEWEIWAEGKFEGGGPALMTWMSEATYRRMIDFVERLRE